LGAFGYYKTISEKNKRELFGKITGNLSTFVENYPKPQNLQKSPKKLLHFPKKYTILKLAQVKNKNAKQN